MLMTVIGVITATRAEGVRQQEVSHFSSSILSCYSTPDDEAPQKKKKTSSSLSHIPLLLMEVIPPTH